MLHTNRNQQRRQRKWWWGESTGVSTKISFLFWSQTFQRNRVTFAVFCRVTRNPPYQIWADLMVMVPLILVWNMSHATHHAPKKDAKERRRKKNHICPLEVPPAWPRKQSFTERLQALNHTQTFPSWCQGEREKERVTKLTDMYEEEASLKRKHRSVQSLFPSLSRLNQYLLKQPSSREALFRKLRSSKLATS